MRAGTESPAGEKENVIKEIAGKISEKTNGWWRYYVNISD